MTSFDTSVRHELQRLEQKHSIRILYAWEAGSRIWGYASSESDLDIRFIYVHPLDWYLSIEEGREVIDLSDHPDFDLNGWELKKALKLFKKSNPSLLEGLHSPIVYQYDEVFLSQMKALEASFFSKKACLHHYLHMAQTNLEKWECEEVLGLKLYLHILRPVLMCRSLLKENRMPALQIEALLEGCPALMIRNVRALIKKQKTKEPLEKDDVLIRAVHPFLQAELAQVSLKATKLGQSPLANQTEGLNRLFRLMVMST